jgi:PBSX family phage portal protein
MTTPAAAKTTRIKSFTFGEPESVLSRRDLLLAVECYHNDRWYEPPIKPGDLNRAYRVAPHHTSAIQYKRNQLVRHFRPSRYLTRAEFGAFALNYLVIGNGYIERRSNLLGQPLSFLNAPALYTRRGVEEGVFWWVPPYGGGRPRERQETPFRAGHVFQLSEPDLAQEIYGLPEYLGALNSGFLNEEATLFRRRYFKNGSHMGSIFYLSEANIDEESADAIEEQIVAGKGAGNFRNMFLHVPGGKKDGVQVIPVGEYATKDEFLGIKGTTRDDILAAHRVPPQLLGVIPQNGTGFGDVRTATDAFHYAEIAPLQLRMAEINDWAGEEIIAFEDYRPMSPQPAAAA